MATASAVHRRLGPFRAPGPDDPLAWGGGPDVLQRRSGRAVDLYMKPTNQFPTGTAPAVPTTRALRRARSAAVVSEPRLQLGFDRRSGEYTLAVL